MTGTLEAHWPLDEDSGSTAYDYSGNENHGTLNNGAGPSGTGTSIGPFGNSAYTFDANDDYVNSSTNFTSIGYPVTISIWIYSNNPDGTHTFTMNQDGTNESMGIDEGGTGTFRLQSYRGSDNTSFALEGDIIPTQEWHHGVAVFTSSEFKVYQNGVETNSTTTTYLPSINYNHYIGAKNRADGGTQLNTHDGHISDLRVYSRALSPQEVQALYQAGVRSEVTFE